MIKNNKLIEVFPNYLVSDQGEVFSTKRGGLKKMSLIKITAGYLEVRLYFDDKYKNQLVHRLVGKAFLGLDIDNPKAQINHINSVRTDNRLENLETCTARENHIHRSLNNSYSSEFTGVSWCKLTSKWRASININNKKKNLGTFITELEASEAYKTALKELI